MTGFARFAVAALMAGGLLAAFSQAQTEDVFAFIPEGGRTILTRIFESRPPPGDVGALLTGNLDRDGWLADLKARGGTIPALARLGDQEMLTLADYLSWNMPLAADRVPADVTRADWTRILPMDGRDIALNYCQSCHIITVVITQDRTREAWLGSLGKPSHVEIELTPRQREALASYLVLNAAIPIDLVPEELRAGGATY